MAKKKKLNWNIFTKATVGKEALDKIGTYEEAPGGGTPVKGGGRGAMRGDFKVVDSKEEADKIRETDPGAKIRYNQPRDEEGKFTYNSSNAKELVYGPSRGHTIPPFLRGVDIKFAEVGSKIRTRENGKYVTLLSTINMSKEAIIEACKEYVKEEEGFLGMNKGTTIEKKGRASKAEKATKGTGFVTDKDGNRENFDFSKAAASTQQAAADAQKEYQDSSAGKYEDVIPEAFGSYEKFKEIIKKKIREKNSGKSDIEPPRPGTKVSAKPKTPVTPTGELTEEEQASKLFGEDLKSEKPKRESKLSEENAQKALDVVKTFGEEYSDIDIDDIYDMYEDGSLTDEDLTELGIVL